VLGHKKGRRTLQLWKMNGARRGSMDVPASGYICAIFLSVGSEKKHSIFFSRLGEFSLSLFSTVSWTHLSSLPHTLPLIIISPLCYFVIVVVYKISWSLFSHYFNPLCLNRKTMSHELPYFPAHKTHFFSWKMWPKFNLCLMCQG